MKTLTNAAVYIVFTLLFILVVLPVGLVVRRLFDPLRLRGGACRDTYLRKAMPRPGLSRPPALIESEHSLARKS